MSANEHPQIARHERLRSVDGASFLGNAVAVILLDGEVRLADGYVFVCNDAVPNQLRARKILLAVDKVLEASGVRAVMFDTREMEPPSEEVNTLLRAWVDRCTYHDKVALLVKSDLKRIASNMRALSVGVKMRSFHDLAEAEAWLRKPVIKPRQAREVADDAPQPRERIRTEPIDLPPRRPERKSSREAESGTKRRWRSPLLQQLNKD